MERSLRTLCLWCTAAAAVFGVLFLTFGTSGPDPLGITQPRRAAAAPTVDVDQFLNDMSEYYEGAATLDELFLLPLTDEGLLPLAQRMRSDRFVIGAIGSSVTAGHDNCHYDSYTSQLERVLAPLFAHYGKTVEVRNAGQGGGCGDSFHNQIWCTRHMVGDDVDAIHYSWSYFESGSRDKTQFHELFIRWSLLMDRAPVPT